MAALAGYPGMYLWYFAMRDSTVPVAIWGPISFVLLGMTFVAGTILWLWSRNRTDLKNEALDERQRQVRDRVYVLSYQALSAFIALIATPIVIAAAFGAVFTVDFNTLVPFIVGFAIYFPALPIMVLAWIEPDAEDEDA